MKTKLVWVIVGVALAACGGDDRPMAMVDSGGIDAAMPDSGMPLPDAAGTDAGGDAGTVDPDGGPLEPDASMPDASMPDGGPMPASCSVTASTGM